MRYQLRLSLDVQRAIFAVLFLAAFSATSASATTPAFRRVGTIDSSTATANQACYWNGSDLECNTTNPTITATGLVGIGSTSPTVSFDISQKTDAVSLPVGTTGTRPTGVNGMIRYNSALPGLEAYVNGVWSTVQSSGITSGVLGVANGGTGDSTLTAHGVIVGEGASPLAATSAGAIDTVLVGNGASSDPTFSASPTLSGVITDLQSIGATSTDGLVLQNTTAAATGAQQWSPRVHFSGQGFETYSGLSQNVDMIEELQPIQGNASPTGNLTWSSSVNGAAYSPLMTLTTAGSVGIGTSTPTYALDIFSNNSTLYRAKSATNGAIWFLGVSFANNNMASMQRMNDVSNGSLNIGAYGDIGFTPGNGLPSVSTGSALYITSGGKIGIGTTSPGSSLQVNGGAAVGYSTNTAAPTNGMIVQGNVGIGTTAPAASVKADINGMVKVAGTGSEPCTAAQVGAMRYNPTGNYFELCSYP